MLLLAQLEGSAGAGLTGMRHQANSPMPTSPILAHVQFVFPLAYPPSFIQSTGLSFCLLSVRLRSTPDKIQPRLTGAIIQQRPAPMARRASFALQLEREAAQWGAAAEEAVCGGHEHACGPNAGLRGRGNVDRRNESGAGLHWAVQQCAAANGYERRGGGDGKQATHMPGRSAALAYKVWTASRGESNRGGRRQNCPWTGLARGMCTRLAAAAGAKIQAGAPGAGRGGAARRPPVTPSAGPAGSRALGVHQAGAAVGAGLVRRRRAAGVHRRVAAAGQPPARLHCGGRQLQQARLGHARRHLRLVQPLLLVLQRLQGRAGRGHGRAAVVVRGAGGQGGKQRADPTGLHLLSHQPTPSADGPIATQPRLLPFSSMSLWNPLPTQS